MAAQAVEGVAALHGHAGVRHVGDLDGAVHARFNCLGDVLAYLVRIHVESSGHVHVADRVGAELGVHEAGDVLGRGGVRIKVNSLDQ